MIFALTLFLCHNTAPKLSIFLKSSSQPLQDFPGAGTGKTVPNVSVNRAATLQPAGAVRAGDIPGRTSPDPTPRSQGPSALAESLSSPQSKP